MALYTDKKWEDTRKGREGGLRVLVRGHCRKLSLSDIDYMWGVCEYKKIAGVSCESDGSSPLCELPVWLIVKTVKHVADSWLLTDGMFGSLIQHMQVKVKGAVPASCVWQQCLLSARNMEKHLKRVETEACWKREKIMFEVEFLQEACVETLGPLRLAKFPGWMRDGFTWGWDGAVTLGCPRTDVGWCIYTRLSQDWCGMVHLH